MDDLLKLISDLIIKNEAQSKKIEQLSNRVTQIAFVSAENSKLHKSMLQMNTDDLNNKCISLEKDITDIKAKLHLLPNK